jgi:hypothetical protein
MAVIDGGPVFRKAGRYDLSPSRSRLLGDGAYRAEALDTQTSMKRIRKPVGGERWNPPSRHKCSFVCNGQP